MGNYRVDEKTDGAEIDEKFKESKDKKKERRKQAREDGETKERKNR